MSRHGYTSPKESTALALAFRLPHQPAPRPHFADPERIGDFHTAASPPPRQPPPTPSVNNRRDGARTLRNHRRTQQRPCTFRFLSPHAAGSLEIPPRSLRSVYWFIQGHSGRTSQGKYSETTTGRIAIAGTTEQKELAWENRRCDGQLLIRYPAHDHLTSENTPIDSPLNEPTDQSTQDMDRRYWGNI